MFNSFVVGWETEWFVYNTAENPTIEAAFFFEGSERDPSDESENGGTFFWEKVSVPVLFIPPNSVFLRSEPKRPIGCFKSPHHKNDESPFRGFVDRTVSGRSIGMSPREALSSFCNWVFLIELVLRLAAFRMDFFCNRERRNWNIFATWNSVAVGLGLGRGLGLGLVGLEGLCLSAIQIDLTFKRSRHPSTFPSAPSNKTIKYNHQQPRPKMYFSPSKN